MAFSDDLAAAKQRQRAEAVAQKERDRKCREAHRKLTPMVVSVLEVFGNHRYGRTLGLLARYRVVVGDDSWWLEPKDQHSGGVPSTVFVTLRRTRRDIGSPDSAEDYHLSISSPFEIEGALDPSREALERALLRLS